MIRRAILLFGAAFILAALTLLPASACAQQLRTAYFMDTPARLPMNPALRPDADFVAIPVAGSSGVSFATNGMRVSDLFQPRGDKLITFLDPSVDADQFLSRLRNVNQINVDMATNLLWAGWYSGDRFWSIGLGLKSTSTIGLPKSLFEFMKIGNGAGGSTYDLRNLSVHSNTYIDASVGMSMPLSHRLTVGARAKLILGAAGIRARFDKLTASLTDDQWQIDADGMLNISSGFTEAELSDDDEGLPYFSGLDMKWKGLPKALAGLGMGVDLGAVYRLCDNITLSAAIVDLGFIRWRSSSTFSAVSQSRFTFDGFDITVGEIDFNSMDDQIDELAEDLKRMTRFRPDAAKGYTSSLTATLNIGGQYSMYDGRLNFGLLSSTRFYRPRPYTEITVSANYRPLDWFSATFSYSILHSGLRTCGAALNFTPRGFNFFIGSDYLLIGKLTKQYWPVNSRVVNLQMGMYVSLGK